MSEESKEANLSIMRAAMEYLANHPPKEKTVAQIKQDILLGLNDDNLNTKYKIKKFINEVLEPDVKGVIKDLGIETGIILTIPQAKKILSLLN